MPRYIDYVQFLCDNCPNRLSEVLGQLFLVPSHTLYVHQYVSEVSGHSKFLVIILTGLHMGLVGRPCNLSAEEECRLEEEIAVFAMYGVFLTRAKIFRVVQRFIKKRRERWIQEGRQDLLEKEKKFKNDDTPTKNWFYGFLQRHEGLRTKIPEVHMKSSSTSIFVLILCFSSHDSRMSMIIFKFLALLFADNCLEEEPHHDSRSLQLLRELLGDSCGNSSGEHHERR